MAGVRWVTVTSLSAIHSARRPGVPMSSAVGTYRLAPKKRGVNTRNQRHHLQIFCRWCPLTIALNGIVSDTAQHRELRLFADAKPLAHPREEMRQAVVPAFDPLGNTSASTGE